MSGPEDNPADDYPNYPCDCGGSITKDAPGENWSCDKCGKQFIDSNKFGGLGLGSDRSPFIPWF
jgi:hypothetical protein